MKLLFDHGQRLDERVAMIATRSTGAQRNIQRESFAFAAAALACGTGTGVEGILMGGEVENRRIRPEDVLCTVSVMDVPIDDENPLDAVRRLRVSRGHRGVVEQTEAHRTIDCRVMARRTDQT